jgi:hypothetical protein
VHGRGGHTSAKLGLARLDHHAHVIIDRKWPLKKRLARSKYSFLNINRNDLIKPLIRPNLAFRRVPGCVCSVPVCVNADFVASTWAWHYKLVLCRWSERQNFGDGWACPRHSVTFEHRQVLSRACNGEGMSVNEAVYTGTVGPDGGRRRCEVDMVAMGWCCSAPKEMR